MTKSTITRERAQQIFLGNGPEPSASEERELARMALAAMDSEPDCNERKLFCSTDTARMRKVISVSAGIEGAPLYRHAQPALVIPDEMTAEQAYEIGYYYGDPVNVFARGANWMRQHIIDSTLAAAQHDTPALNSVQSVVTVPGKWIPVSERMPEDEQEVLTINKMGHRFVSFFDKHSGLFFDRLDAPAACCIERVLVTHWMPLPAAPQEVKP
ncbi:DUF551 domain-containing protein [Klebsiella variicola]|uniref:DUF551 domain-containing protein n=2 Tax=Klebsiella pneumoniae complex TaxID=3390273 RepID=A0AAW9PEW4_KLEVA|nr:DUF551 domain-containing protein [Klebsiella variicola]MDU2186558.1 DUF551 domain-containing protein [Klebsiella pneumoniae]MEC6056896.1 DUF551 domain-containing protein [Klebsiella variicola]HDZ9428865.1 DUF551 domain-containing protein [Klebsiella pneumoniae]HDZ9778561.1 DUF551 domain-containing protein [Klebsiella pneumoniae]